MNSIAKRFHDNNQLSFEKFLFICVIPWLKKRKTNPMVCYQISDFSLKTRILHVYKDLFVKNKPNGMFNRKSMSHQKTLKVTNKAILKTNQMNITKVLTSYYNRLDTWYSGKNKAISNPFCSIKPQKPALDI